MCYQRARPHVRARALGKHVRRRRRRIRTMRNGRVISSAIAAATHGRIVTRGNVARCANERALDAPQVRLAVQLATPPAGEAGIGSRRHWLGDARRRHRFLPNCPRIVRRSAPSGLLSFHRRSVHRREGGTQSGVFSFESPNAIAQSPDANAQAALIEQEPLLDVLDESEHVVGRDLQRHRTSIRQSVDRSARCTHPTRLRSVISRPSACVR